MDQKMHDMAAYVGIVWSYLVELMALFELSLDRLRVDRGPFHNLVQSIIYSRMSGHVHYLHGNIFNPRTTLADRRFHFIVHVVVHLSFPCVAF